MTQLPKPLLFAIITSFYSSYNFVLLSTNGKAIQRVDRNRLITLIKEIQTTWETGHIFWLFTGSREVIRVFCILQNRLYSTPNVINIRDCCS